MGLPRQLFDFRGRIGRDEFMVALPCVLAGAAAVAWIAYQSLGWLGATLGPRGINAGLIVFAVWWLALGFVVWTTLALSIKRLHDRDRRGWWAFLAIVPMAIVLVLGSTPLLEGNALVRQLSAIPFPFHAVRALVLIKSSALIAIVLIEGLCFTGRDDGNRFGPPPLTAG